MNAAWECLNYLCYTIGSIWFSLLLLNFFSMKMILALILSCTAFPVIAMYPGKWEPVIALMS